jgi:hypothetical protein
MSKDSFLPKDQKDEISALLNRLDGCDDFKRTFTLDEKDMVKEGYLLLSKGLLTKQNRVQESEEKISITKNIPGKGTSTKEDKNNLAYANTPEVIDEEITTLRNGAVGLDTTMYLNINGSTNEYRIERIKDEPGKPGFRVFKGNSLSYKKMYEKDIRKAASIAVKSQTKVDEMSQALYEQNK